MHSQGPPNHTSIKPSLFVPASPHIAFTSVARADTITRRDHSNLLSSTSPRWKDSRLREGASQLATGWRLQANDPLQSAYNKHTKLRRKRVTTAPAPIPAALFGYRRRAKHGPIRSAWKRSPGFRLCLIRSRRSNFHTKNNNIVSIDRGKASC